MYQLEIKTKPLKETRNSYKKRPLDFEKKMIEKILRKIPMNTHVTISFTLVC